MGCLLQEGRTQEGRTKKDSPKKDEPRKGDPRDIAWDRLDQDRKGAAGRPAKCRHPTKPTTWWSRTPSRSAQTTPLSTFALGVVHTASYSNVRRFLLDENQLPPRDGVRIAEMVNYFPYTYPQPADDHPVFDHALDLADCPWNVQASPGPRRRQGPAVDPAAMPPRNFVFLIDTSGSMNAPNRLPLLKDSLRLLVEQLGARDRVAIVAYAGMPAGAGADAG